MTIIQTINEFMSMVTESTINGIIIGLWLLLIFKVWKWFWGVIKAFFFDLFPCLKKDKDTKDDV